jgi:hypothetical protein
MKIGVTVYSLHVWLKKSEDLILKRGNYSAGLELKNHQFLSNSWKI